MSDQINEIAAALGKFQGKIEPIGWDAKNPQFNSKYATLAKITETIKEPLSECGLSYTQLGDKEYLTTIIMHTSGQWFSGTMPINGARKVKGGEWREATDPQAFTSAVTYCRRTSLCSALGLAVSGEDDDGNKASGENSNSSANRQKTNSVDQPKKPACSPTALKILHTTGSKLYGKLWDAKRAELCKHYGVSSSTELTDEQLDIVINTYDLRLEKMEGGA